MVQRSAIKLHHFTIHESHKTKGLLASVKHAWNERDAVCGQCLQVQLTREAMRRQLTYLRDGHYIDSDTAGLTSVLLVRQSDNATFAFVEIRTQQMSRGEFEQRGRVWSIATVKADLPKLKMAKWLVVKLSPTACALFMAGCLLACMVCFSDLVNLLSSDHHPNRSLNVTSTEPLCVEPLFHRREELHFSYRIKILYPLG
jgi:hypothetical protein